MATVSPVLEHSTTTTGAAPPTRSTMPRRSRGARACASPTSAARCWRRCSNSHVPASAYDVIDRLAERRQTKRLAPISVYRALDFLVEHRFAHRIESQNAYVACDRGDDCGASGTLFLLCDKCGAAGEASSSELTRLIGGVTDKLGFLPRSPVIEIRGLCAHCRG